jgi:hypothetical protein
MQNSGNILPLNNGWTMATHSHNFVETYDGLVGFGADRNTDENTVIYYLQKFSDDRLMKTIIIDNSPSKKTSLQL